MLEALNSARKAKRFVCWRLQKTAAGRGIAGDAHPKHALAACNHGQIIRNR